jgi:hypothetical protein
MTARSRSLTPKQSFEEFFQLKIKASAFTDLGPLLRPEASETGKD